MNKLIRITEAGAVSLVVTGLFLYFTNTPRQAICGLIGMIVYIALNWEPK